MCDSQKTNVVTDLGMKKVLGSLSETLEQPEGTRLTHPEFGADVARFLVDEIPDHQPGESVKERVVYSLGDLADDVERFSYNLLTRNQNAPYQCIVGVKRGGLVLTERLHITCGAPGHHPIFYSRNLEKEFRNEALYDRGNRQILLVDDILDTGQTLNQVITDICEICNLEVPGQIEELVVLTIHRSSRALAALPQLVLKPYPIKIRLLHAREIDADTWIDYFWELDRPEQ